MLLRWFRRLLRPPWQTLQPQSSNIHSACLLMPSEQRRLSHQQSSSAGINKGPRRIKEYRLHERQTLIRLLVLTYPPP